ncbi:MAG: hypothetical protein ABIY70_23910 [Capsulimonas sp.]|uniref:hypothetical protein n=1 Tax=Capsulimonas sp. TaxID=2494211 RepID=UPI003265432F
MFPMEWLSRGRKQGRESRRQEDLSQIKLWRETSQSLAVSIEQICALCEDLATAAASPDTASAPESTLAMEQVQVQIEAVRRYAACIASDAAGPTADDAPPTAPEIDIDPYSLKELQRLIISEQCE